MAASKGCFEEANRGCFAASFPIIRNYNLVIVPYNRKTGALLRRRTAGPKPQVGAWGPVLFFPIIINYNLIIVNYNRKKENRKEGDPVLFSFFPIRINYNQIIIYYNRSGAPRQEPTWGLGPAVLLRRREKKKTGKTERETPRKKENRKEGGFLFQ
ncbi:MAG: hypothetical protein ACT6SG_20465 [Hydrogenophaga sp.]|uniref:hypothetical protein n=1 Tax=Hydrogenophaga sp. TaxID=1904254 RepID=UPI004035ACA9